MSAETPGTDHDDTEALASRDQLVADLFAGIPEEAISGDLDADYVASCQADSLLASDWLAAYIAGRVETAERERDQALLDHRTSIITAEARGERLKIAAAELAEARAVIERVTALAAKWGERSDALEPRDGDWHADFSYSAYRTCADELSAALAPTTEPASDRPLTLDEHLAEIERRISLRACITGTDRHLDIIRAYREEVRRG